MDPDAVRTPRGAGVGHLDGGASSEELAQFADKLGRRIVSMTGRHWVGTDLSTLIGLLDRVPPAAQARDLPTLTAIFRGLNALDATVASNVDASERGLPAQRPGHAPDRAWPDQRANLALASLRSLLTAESDQPPGPAADEPGKRHWWQLRRR
jgi:hypothetical protein